MYFLTVLEAGSPKYRSQQGWSLVKHLFLACRLLPSHYVFTWNFLCAHVERERSLASHHLLRTMILSDHGPTLIISFTLIISLKALSPNTVTLKVRSSTCEFCGDTIQSITTQVNIPLMNGKNKLKVWIMASIFFQSVNFLSTFLMVSLKYFNFIKSNILTFLSLVTFSFT